MNIFSFPPGRFSIGEVTFIPTDPAICKRCKKKVMHLMGWHRILLLRAFYRHQPLYLGTIPVNAFVWGHGDITHEKVRWDTAGDRVTGEALPRRTHMTG